MVLVDVMAPTSIIIPQAHDTNGAMSGAYVITSAATGAMVMSGGTMWVYSGTKWMSGANLSSA